MYKKNSIYAWVACIISSLFFMYHFIQATILDTMSIYLMKVFNLTAYELANLSSAYFYGNILCLLPAGIILDRVNTKKIICTTLFFLTLSWIIFSMTTNFHLAFLARLIAGFCGGFAFLSSLRLIMNWFSSDKIALILGIIITIGFLGGVFSHRPAIFLAEKFGLNRMFFLLTLLGSAIFLLNLFFLKDNYSFNKLITDKTNNFNIKVILSQIKDILHNPYVWIGGVFTTILNLPVLLLGALWGTLYLHQVQHISIKYASSISALIFWGLIIGTPLVGFYAKTILKIGQLLFVGAICSSIVLGLLILIHLPSVCMLSILFFLFGFFSSTQSVGYSIVLTNSKSELISLSSSIISILIFGGGTVIKLLFGLILDGQWNGDIVEKGVRLYSAANFNIAFLFVECFFILSIFLAGMYIKLKDNAP